MGKVAAMAVIAWLLAPGAARAGDTIQIAVEPGGFDVFAPDDATATLGAESFAFHWVDPPTDDGHNVVSNHGLFDSGPASVDQPDYLLAPSAGSYKYFCEVHSDGKQGMIGRVAVRPAEGNAPPDGGYRVAWATDADPHRRLVRPSVPGRRRKVAELEGGDRAAAGRVRERRDPGRGQSRADVPVRGPLAEGQNALEAKRLVSGPCSRALTPLPLNPVQGLSRRAGFASAAVTALALAAPAIAGLSTDVTVGDDFFEPDTASQILEASTDWSWDDGVLNAHNVRQDAKLFYSGPTTSNPDASFSFSPSAGTYHYYCEEHGTKRGGMDGTLKVKPEVGPADIDGFIVTWGDPSVAGTVRHDVQYKIGNGKWKDWVRNETDLGAEFGADDEPVDVKPGKTYRFRARTEKVVKPGQAQRLLPGRQAHGGPSLDACRP